MTRLKHAIINAMKYRQTLYVPFWGGGGGGGRIACITKTEIRVLEEVFRRD